MMTTPKQRPGRANALVLSLCLWLGAWLLPASAASTLNWNTNQNRVSADLQSVQLLKVLEQVAGATGWHVFVEPDTLHSVSAKFKDLPPGEALRLLLGDVNYALVPDTNTSSRLFVFRTSRQNATQAVAPVRPVEAKNASKIIPNELIVRLRPGAKIDDLAKKLGAKVIGQIDSLNAYRLQFADEDAAASAREQLASNSDVTAVDNNYMVNPPPAPQVVAGGPNLPPPPSLQLKPPPDNGRIIVGLIDTAVQPLGNNLDQFLLKPVSAVDNAAPAGTDSLTHGTAMAETILRSLQSVTAGNTSVQILPVNVYPNSAGEATTSTFDVANGIVQAVNGGAKIINLSLGSPNDSTFLHSVIQDTSKLNIPIYAAAGNDGTANPNYPAAYPEVNGVTAVDNKGKLDPYANYAPTTKLATSGTSIVYFNNQAYVIVGTSSSTASISGITAGISDSKGVSPSQAQAVVNQNYRITIK